MVERTEPCLVPTMGGCLLWDGVHDSGSAPTVYAGGRHTSVARAWWEHVHGPLDQRLVLVRGCGQLPCVALDRSKSWRTLGT